jgi:hypothetical protein
MDRPIADIRGNLTGAGWHKSYKDFVKKTLKPLFLRLKIRPFSEQKGNVRGTF